MDPMAQGLEHPPLRSDVEGDVLAYAIVEAYAMQRALGPQDRVLGVITLSDPAREVDKVQTLFEEVVSARREAGRSEA